MDIERTKGIDITNEVQKLLKSQIPLLRDIAAQILSKIELVVARNAVAVQRAVSVLARVCPVLRILCEPIVPLL